MLPVVNESTSGTLIVDGDDSQPSIATSASPSAAEPAIGFQAGIGLQWFALSLGIGIAMGFLLYLLTRVRCREEELLIFVVGMVTFSSGIALYLELSPLFVNATMGITQYPYPRFLLFSIIGGFSWAAYTCAISYWASEAKKRVSR